MFVEMKKNNMGRFIWIRVILLSVAFVAVVYTMNNLRKNSQSPDNNTQRHTLIDQ